MNVLIVDDNPTNLKLLRAMLEVEGHCVLQAADGVEALQLLEREGAEAIISDILMPRMDGYRLCHEVRKSERFENLPFIFYTATYTSPGDKKFSLELGADLFLSKPASTAEIAGALRHVMAEGGKLRAGPRASMLESDVLKEYSERLVVKLEQKNLQLTQTLEELNSERARLRHLLDYSPAVIYTMKLGDARVVPTVVSENITRLLGFTVEKSCSFDWWAAHIHPEDREQALASIPETLQRGVLGCEYRLRHKDGHYLWVEDNRQLVRDCSNHPKEIVGMWTEITERKRAEEEIRQLNARLEQRVVERTAQLQAAVKEIEAFSYTVSHDLRAPIRAMDGYSRILLEDYGEKVDDEGRRTSRMLGSAPLGFR
jgi:PAS domain S-box-containing protein